MHIHDDSICYVALNIPSYMGGRANPWHQAGEKVGLRNPYQKSGQPKDINSPKNLNQQLSFHKQDPADGKLEFVSFTNTFQQGIAKKGNKLIQDEGPIEFKFKEPNQQAADSFTYLNIDGEFYKLKNPDTVTLQLAKDALPEGRLKILVRKIDE